MRTPPGVQKTGDRRSSGSPGVQGQLGSPKKVMNGFFSPGDSWWGEWGKLVLERCGSTLLFFFLYGAVDEVSFHVLGSLYLSSW
jgi:hypothetical protein